MDVVVTGIGLRTCLGSFAQTWGALLRGETGIKIAQPFLDFAPLPLGLIGTEPSHLDNLVPSLVEETLADAELKLPLENCAVVVGSSRGAQGRWEQWARSPNLGEIPWLEYLPDQAAALTVRSLGGAELALSPMTACATGLWAIANGVDLIRQGRCHQAIVGAVETPITPLTLAGFSQMGALAKTGCYPFDQKRDGLVLAEGGALFVLEAADHAQQRGARIYGKIAGWSMTCDASHGIAPAPDNRSAICAVKQCLERSQLSAFDIQFIHAHGTGTRLNDRREADLIHHCFPVNIAVGATKGATGHTLGASGALGVALSLMALHAQQLPPLVGLNQPDNDLNLIQAATLTHLENILCFSFGFGGQNAVLAVQTIR